MKLYTFALLCVLLVIGSEYANADIVLHGSVFAFNDKQTHQDYKGLSPLGEYGIKYVHTIDHKFSVHVGIKHTSSIGYREQGSGFNGTYVQGELKLW